MAKPTIVTRAGKGAPLSTTEGDSNFTNLRDSTFGFVVDGTTITNELNSAFTIESGTGITVVGNNSTKKVTISNSKVLASEGSPTLGGDLAVDGFKIVTSSNNLNIELDPHGTGVVAVTGPMTISGNLTVSGTTTTVNSTTVDIADKNITLAKGSANKAAAGGAGITIDLGSDGTAGFEYVQATDRFLFDRQIAGSFFSNAASNFSGGTVNLGSNSNVTLTGGSLGQVLRTDGAGALTWVNQAAGGITSLVQDAAPQLGGDLDVNALDITTSQANGSISIKPLGTGFLRVGSGLAAGKITSRGARDLILSTNNSTDSGYITITTGADGNISLTPNGAGKVSLSGNLFPSSMGTNGYYLQTNGSGTLTWAAVSSGIASVSADTTPALGGNLNVGTNTITTATTDGNISLVPNGNGYVKVGSGALPGKITTNGAYNLLLNTNSGTDSGQIIINQGINGNIALLPNGTGKVAMYGAYRFPSNDGSADQYLKTNGSGDLTWATVSSGWVGTATSDLNMATYKIKSTSNQNLVFETANSTYGMDFKSNTNKFGYLDTQAVITTNGAGSLQLNTNSGTDSGSIIINQGLNSNIGINPNGTGKIMLNGALGLTSTTGTPTTYNTSYFEGTLDTPAAWFKVTMNGSSYYLPMFQ